MSHPKKWGFDDSVLETATSKRMRGFGLHSLMYETIRAAGMSIHPGGDKDELIRLAFEADRKLQASAVSNLSMSSTLGNSANKMIVQGFNSVEQTWAEIAAIGNARDFKTHTRHRLTGDFTYEELGKNGEIKHAEMGETTYTSSIDTYAKMFGIDRKNLINDDLEALQSNARLRTGRGAALKINNVFWTVFMANTSFFTSARGNFADGAATALDVDSLTTAEKLFMDQTDENGDPVSIMPAILLVPNALFVTGDTLMASTEVRDTTANTKRMTKNPHAGKFRVVRSSYLGNANYTGNSVLKWYLLNDPNDLDVAVIRMSFLNGQRMPTVETTDLDFNTLGIQMRGYHDFGADKEEYRCGVAMKGEA